MWGALGWYPNALFCLLSIGPHPPFGRRFFLYVLEFINSILLMYP
ncbi:hypothetical protein [Pseudopedobacter sp.]